MIEIPARDDDPNLAMLELVVNALGDLCESLVFLGGCATSLLVTVQRAKQIRVTEDVDVVAKAATIHEYHAVEAQLRARGFKQDGSPGAPICRWVGAGTTLDVMPSEPGILSFDNRWYSLAVKTAQDVRLPSGRIIKLVTAPVFIATKIDAMRDRSAGDYLSSHDLEDIVTVVDGRPSLSDEMSSVPAELRAYIKKQLGSLLSSSSFMDALQGHLPGDAASQARLPELIRRLRSLAGAGASRSREASYSWLRGN